MITRYVNTASSAGGDGTTNGTAGATRAFATLLEAINSLPGTLLDATTIFCEGSAADTASIYQTPWDFVTSPTNYLLITTQGGQRHQGIYNTGIYRLEVVNEMAIYFNTSAHIRIDCLQAQVTVNDSTQYNVFRTTNLNMTASDVDCRLSNCLAKGVLTSGNVVGFFTSPVTGAGVCGIWNCIAIDCYSGFNNDTGCQHLKLYNCGAYDCQVGFVDDDGAGTVRNCLSKGAVVGFIGTFTDGSSHNAEDDGNGVPGTSGQSGQTFTFVNAGADDFHLAAGDVGAKNLGTNLSGDATFPFSTDIDGQTRSGTWDIGPDEFVVPSAARPSKLTLQSVNRAATY